MINCCKKILENTIALIFASENSYLFLFNYYCLMSQDSNM